jgi:bifunctional UDP-N-acetylglucosamine pyrophosphorylase/glucosamine-1-phosphate N-acetyltransferase
MALVSLILATGRDPQMNSVYPTALQPVLGKPMLAYAVATARECGADPLWVVTGPATEQVSEIMGPELNYLSLPESRETGQALLSASEALADCSGDVLVLPGNMPLLTADALRQLLEEKRAQGASAAVLTLERQKSSGGDRIIQDAAGLISAVIPEEDATEEQRQNNAADAGVYCFGIGELLAALAKLSPRTGRGEYSLAEVFTIMLESSAKVIGVPAGDPLTVFRPTDRMQLARTEKCLKEAINDRWMRDGVTLADPDFTYIGPDVVIGRDTRILPGTFLFGKSMIGENCTIGPHTRIVDSSIGRDSVVEHSQVLQSRLGAANQVGPFAFIRPGTVTASKVKIGDFVELKNCQIEQGSKVPHLTYLGDTEVGAGVNIGAGTITCNYDGVHKHRTIIGDGAFIGSNSNLVAPVKVGAGATVGAGSTITKEVPPGALAVARSRQEVKPEWRSPRDRAGK